MVRVLTRSGLVDVTTDHSLLRADGTPATPREVSIGNALMHADFPCIPEAPDHADAVMCPDHAHLAGFHFGEGMARGHEAAGRTFEISAGKHASEDRLVPMSILGAPDNVRTAFWAGVFAADVTKEVGEAWIDLKTQWSAATLVLLAASLGYSVSFAGAYRVQATKTVTVPPANGLVSIQDLPPDSEAYVYDLTTANHHFAAGVGRLVVHNTDSVMCILNLGEDKRHDMAAHFQAAERLAGDISKTFPKPVELEFEKCYYPYLLFSKKRYAGLMFTDPATPDYVDVKGLQLVRRDNCPLVKDVSTAILNKIMYERSAALAVEEARACILRVLGGTEPLEKFIVSKSLRADYKNTAQPHVYVAKKIFRRTGAAVPSGVRVPFVFIEDSSKAGGLLAERAEDPEHVRAHDLKIDVLHYIRHQLESPIEALLELLVDNPGEAVFGHETICDQMAALELRNDTDIKEAKRVRKNVANNQQEITSFFKAAAK